MNIDNSLHSHRDPPNSPGLSDSLKQTYTNLTDNSPPDMSPFLSNLNVVGCFEKNHSVFDVGGQTDDVNALFNMLDMDMGTDMSLFEFATSSVPSLGALNETDHSSNSNLHFGCLGPLDAPNDRAPDWKELDETRWKALISQLTDYEQVNSIQSRLI